LDSSAQATGGNGSSGIGPWWILIGLLAYGLIIFAVVKVANAEINRATKRASFSERRDDLSRVVAKELASKLSTYEDDLPSAETTLFNFLKDHKDYSKDDMELFIDFSANKLRLPKWHVRRILKEASRTLEVHR